MKQYLMGNGAIAMGALAAGAGLAAGYPGTPSSEIIETIAANAGPDVHVEWSVNEKAAMEVAAAACYSGVRSIVTMKQMGLNVASDPLMCLAYMGIKGGLVVVSADDPGPISSQTEQDTRRFADFCRIPVFDPSSPEEAFQMVQDAFELSEKYETPVILRPTTRICHAYAAIETPDAFEPKKSEGFIKDTDRWVIFPRLSYLNHGKVEKRNAQIARELSDYAMNRIEGEGTRAVAASGISYSYVKESLKDHPEIRLIRLATAFPLPEEFMLRALDGVNEVLVFEELSPYVEEQILKLAGKHHLNLNVKGKLTGHLPHNGEMSPQIAAKALHEVFGLPAPREFPDITGGPVLPQRPPVLCAGCSHRASFYAVKRAMKGRKAIYCGDIGCYTLANAQPLDMCDTCLCMGAAVTMAQGFAHTDKDVVSFGFIGDSTFFASSMTGVVNAVHNEANMILCVLDNSTTAMTGHQPHPGTGRNMMGHTVDKVDIAAVLRGMGVKTVETVNPFRLEETIETVRRLADEEGTKAIIFKAPCVALIRVQDRCTVDPDKCINCRKCITESGCPALISGGDKVSIDPGQCSGCRLCAQICPVDAIGGGSDE